MIFTSDNGPHSEGGHKHEYFDANGPLRGFKRDLYEGGIKMPFVAKWPKVIKPGTTSDHISAYWDLLPTFCEIAKTKVTANTDGISLSKSFKGKEKKREEDNDAHRI